MNPCPPPTDDTVPGWLFWTIMAGMGAAILIIAGLAIVAFRLYHEERRYS